MVSLISVRTCHFMAVFAEQPAGTLKLYKFDECSIMCETHNIFGRSR